MPKYRVWFVHYSAKRGEMVVEAESMDAAVAFVHADERGPEWWERAKFSKDGEEEFVRVVDAEEVS